MLLSILANLIGLYSLVTLPAIVTQTIDSNVEGNINLISAVYKKDAPYRLNSSSLGIKISAASAMVVDKRTNSILWQKNPEEARPIASITKLMTALVFLDNNPGWQTEVTIQESDSREGGRVRVYNGEKMYVKDLFNASLVASSNNSTMALARSTGLTEEGFVEAMNQKAQELGMSDSIFFEPTGLDPANVSTAFDIIKLAQTALSQPDIAAATKQKEYKFSIINAPRNYTLKNTDRLLNSYLNVVSGKTGFLDEAGYCLVSNIDNNGHEVLVVVLGSETEDSRFQEVKALSQWSFDNYYWPETSMSES